MLDNNKKQYVLPEVSRIELDNEISLALASSPPIGPVEGNNLKLPEVYTDDPYKMG